MARQRYSHQSAPCHRATPVSVDRAASPTPHARGKSPASRRGRAKSRETRTLRWRKKDSNHRSLLRETKLFETARLTLSHTPPPFPRERTGRPWLQRLGLELFHRPVYPRQGDGD